MSNNGDGKNRNGRTRKENNKDDDKSDNTEDDENETYDKFKKIKKKNDQKFVNENRIFNSFEGKEKDNEHNIELNKNDTKLNYLFSNVFNNVKEKVFNQFSYMNIFSRMSISKWLDVHDDSNTETSKNNLNLGTALLDTDNTLSSCSKYTIRSVLNSSDTSKTVINSNYLCSKENRFKQNCSKCRLIKKMNRCKGNSMWHRAAKELYNGKKHNIKIVQETSDKLIRSNESNDKEINKNSVMTVWKRNNSETTQLQCCFDETRNTYFEKDKIYKHHKKQCHQKIKYSDNVDVWRKAAKELCKEKYAMNTEVECNVVTCDINQKINDYDNITSDSDNKTINNIPSRLLFDKYFKYSPLLGNINPVNNIETLIPNSDWLSNKHVVILPIKSKSCVELRYVSSKKSISNRYNVNFDKELNTQLRRLHKIHLAEKIKLLKRKNADFSYNTENIINGDVENKTKDVINKLGWTNISDHQLLHIYNKLQQKVNKDTKETYGMKLRNMFTLTKGNKDCFNYYYCNNRRVERVNHNLLPKTGNNVCKVVNKYKFSNLFNDYKLVMQSNDFVDRHHLNTEIDEDMKTIVANKWCTENLEKTRRDEISASNVVQYVSNLKNNNNVNMTLTCHPAFLKKLCRNIGDKKKKKKRKETIDIPKDYIGTVSSSRTTVSSQSEDKYIRPHTNKDSLNQKPKPEKEIPATPKESSSQTSKSIKSFGDSKSSQSKSGESKSIKPKPIKSKSSESKSIESKSISKSSESKSIKSKSSESKSTEREPPVNTLKNDVKEETPKDPPKPQKKKGHKKVVNETPRTGTTAPPSSRNSSYSNLSKDEQRTELKEPLTTNEEPSVSVNRRSVQLPTIASVDEVPCPICNQMPDECHCNSPKDEVKDEENKNKKNCNKYCKNCRNPRTSSSNFSSRPNNKSNIEDNDSYGNQAIRLLCGCCFCQPECSLKESLKKMFCISIPSANTSEARFCFKRKKKRSRTSTTIIDKDNDNNNRL